MVDVISILGLAIAVFDQLLKAGERTHQLLSDVKGYNQDATRFQRDVAGENTSNKLLQRILFDRSPIYGGRSLFEQFPAEVQEEIKLDFVETENVVEECIKILERRYSGSQGDSGSSDGRATPDSTSSSTSSSLTLTNSADSASNTKKDYFHKAPLWVQKGVRLSQWSLRDKKRIGEIVLRFVGLNRRVHGKIKLCSLAGSLGLDLQHLQRLAEDPTSIDLGFNVDAGLKLLREEVHKETNSCALQDDVDWWAGSLQIGENFAFAELEGKAIVIETHDYKLKAPFVSSESLEIHSDDKGASDEKGANTTDANEALDRRTKKEVNRLAGLLRQPKEHLFRIPRCLGWKYRPLEHRIDLAFEIGASPQGAPVSLLSLLKMDLKLTLNDKFKLAYALATSLSHLQMIRWVHESFRSENILFWTSQDMTTDIEMYENEIDYSQPWVLGFEYSRPDSGFSAGPGDFKPERDIYRHPERQGMPEARFTKIHDIYALGVVLLEIALWEPALQIAGDLKTKDKPGSGRSRNWFVKQATRRLKSRMGEKYRDIVIKCLMSEFDTIDDTKEDLQLQQNFRREVCDVLRKALDSV